MLMVNVVVYTIHVLFTLHKLNIHITNNVSGLLSTYLFYLSTNVKKIERGYFFNFPAHKWYCWQSWRVEVILQCRFRWQENKKHYRTLTKTRKYVIDGQVVTTQTSRVVITGEENRSREDHNLRWGGSCLPVTTTACISLPHKPLSSNCSKAKYFLQE